MFQWIWILIVLSCFYCQCFKCKVGTKKLTRLFLQILESLSLQYIFQCSSACRNYPTAATYGLEQSSFLNITLTSCKIVYYVYFFPCRKTLFPDREPSIWTGTQTSNLKVTSWLLWPLQVAHLLFLTQDARNSPWT